MALRPRTAKYDTKQGTVDPPKVAPSGAHEWPDSSVFSVLHLDRRAPKRLTSDGHKSQRLTLTLAGLAFVAALPDNKGDLSRQR